MRMSIGYLKPLVNFFGREEKIKMSRELFNL